MCLLPHARSRCHMAGLVTRLRCLGGPRLVMTMCLLIITVPVARLLCLPHRADDQVGLDGLIESHKPNISFYVCQDAHTVRIHCGLSFGHVQRPEDAHDRPLIHLLSQDLQPTLVALGLDGLPHLKQAPDACEDGALLIQTKQGGLNLLHHRGKVCNVIILQGTMVLVRVLVDGAYVQPHIGVIPCLIVSHSVTNDIHQGGKPPGPGM
mmetsp:Transcript_15440/g.38445  ORF Transcript_15440/g.38445 Transcript_15440/m.38445 type:complete len:208 (+) Transcript_15440:61-684(+)